MRLEIPIKEVRAFLNNYYHINVDLKNVEEDKIKVIYFGSVVLSIKEIKEDIVLFYYEVNEFVELIAEGFHFFLKKELETDSIEWDSETREIMIDLNKVQELKELLKLLYISEIHFENENILLVLNIRDKI